MDLLERIRSPDSAAQRDDGIPFRVCRGEARCQVRDARAGSRDRDSRTSGHATDAARDESCILLVTAHDGLDRGIDQRVEYCVDLGSRHAEHVRDTVLLERANDQIRANLRTLLFFVWHFSTP